MYLCFEGVDHFFFLNAMAGFVDQVHKRFDRIRPLIQSLRWKLLRFKVRDTRETICKKKIPNEIKEEF